MSDIFGGKSYLDWSLNDPMGVSISRQAAVAYPNGGAVPVNRPAVDTGGSDWGSWVDRLINGAIAFRGAGQGGDARMTAYPGTGMYGLSYAGQEAAPAGGSIMPLLLMGGLALAAFMILKD